MLNTLPTAQPGFAAKKNVANPPSEAKVRPSPATKLAADKAAMRVQDNHIGRVIGKQGTFVKEIQAVSGARVQVGNANSHARKQCPHLHR